MTSVLILRSRALLHHNFTLHFLHAVIYTFRKMLTRRIFFNKFTIFFSMCSLQAFVKDASSFSHEAVDRLLDVLTEGAHSKYVKHIAEVRLSELCESWSLDAQSPSCNLSSPCMYFLLIYFHSFLFFSQKEKAEEEKQAKENQNSEQKSVVTVSSSEVHLNASTVYSRY